MHKKLLCMLLSLTLLVAATGCFPANNGDTVPDTTNYGANGANNGTGYNNGTNGGMTNGTNNQVS